MDCSTPGFLVLHHLLDAQNHVHLVDDAIQPSHPPSSPSPALNLSQHQGFFIGPGGCEWNVGTDGHHLALAQGEGEAPGLHAPTGGAPAPGRGVRRDCSECFQQATLRANAQKIKAVEAMRRVLRLAGRW